MVLRIFKMIATSGFLTALECTSKGEGRDRGKEEGKGREREGKERDQPPFCKSLDPPLTMNG